MARAIDWAFKAMEAAIVALLAGMVAMVFGNVVLRYAFNSGIDVSDEFARFFFVWLTFIGAVVTFRENAHLGVETLVRRFGHPGRTVCLVLSDLAIIGCCAVFFAGTLAQHEINATNRASVSGLPMSYVYGIGYFASLGIGLIAATRLLRLATGRLPESEINAFAGEVSGEAAQVKERAE